METDNKTFFLKIQGKCNIPVPLAVGHNFGVICDCSITSEMKVDNQDGTFDVIYKAEPATISIQKDNGPIIKAKDPRRNHIKMRNFLFKEHFNSGEVHDFDRVYDEFTWVVMSHMPELYREAVLRMENK